MNNVPTPNASGAVQATAGQKFESLAIESNGLAEGTTITLNGKAIKDLASLRFYFSSNPYGGVSIEYTTTDHDVKPGEIRETSNFYVRPPEQGVAHVVEAGELPAQFKATGTANESIFREM
jgi:hypothetical protein